MSLTGMRPSSLHRPFSNETESIGVGPSPDLPSGKSEKAEQKPVLSGRMRLSTTSLYVMNPGFSNSST
eukprot:CAMPEP_0180250184 /NCGR_PEP_ID=MMETSP0987-20121128/37734_1 /TAXON_ID=697907 /ORGANISM="non described non described, Strain CCMP2293" /LENGTH=67 /DNA_ID=CAMNT_0022218573 /DNA_START=98 /DNA_END=298 /DNA_ORIENTATION=+